MNRVCEIFRHGRGAVIFVAMALMVGSPSSVRAAASGQTVSLNEASVEEFLKLPGMDRRTAEKIVYLRDQTGNFTSVQQLLSVPGMTPERLNAWESQLSLEQTREAESFPRRTVQESQMSKRTFDDASSARSAYLSDAAAGEEGTSLDTSFKGDESVLQQLQENPLDINKAREEEFRDLPRVDRRIARRIVRLRAQKRRFNSLTELKEVEGIDDAQFEEIRPYIKVKPVYVRDAFFSGDTRMRVRNVNPRGGTFFGASSEFQNNTYIYNRTRLRFGDHSQVGWLAKRASVGAPLTPENVQRLTVFKFSAQESDLGALDKIVLGNYTLSYGQGLVFYDGLGEYVRPVKVKGRGPRPDFTSGGNEYHQGAALEGRVGDLNAALFVSQKELDFKVDPVTGKIDADIYSLRQQLGDLQDEDDLVNNDTVTERLYGGRLSYGFLENTVIGLTGYEADYSHVFDPTQSTFSFSHVFRGDKNVIGGVDFDTHYRSLNFFGEVAVSRAGGPGVKKQKGTAWTATPLLRLKPVDIWTTFFDYDADFFTRHGKGTSYAIVGAPEELTDNQRGVLMGFHYQGRHYMNKTNYTIATFPEPLGNGNNSNPIQASQGRQIYFENLYKVSRSLDLYVRYQRNEQDLYPSLRVASGGSTRRQTIQDVQKYRYQVTWTARQGTRYRVRYETRYEDLPLLQERAFGHLVMGDVRYKPTRDLTLNARVYFFDSPDAFLTTGVEEIWNRVVYYRLAGAMNSLRGEPGTRFYLIAKQGVGKDLDVWMKYDVNYRPGSLRTIQSTPSAQEDKAFGATRQGFHVQVDYKWGGAERRPAGESEYRTPFGDWTEQG